MSATPLLPTNKLENWKYSPVRLIPQNYNATRKVDSLVLKKSEEKTLVTRFENGEAFSSTKLEIAVAENATLHHWCLFNETPESTHLDEIKVNIERSGRYVLNAVTIGSKWSRSDLHIKLLGEGAQCELRGLDLAKGEGNIERHLLIEHLVPHTSSAQLFKGIFAGKATSSFFGKVKVHHGADGTVANQINRNLLLSPHATANTRPQLEIDTDEVSCTHGATVGQLDDEAVFFMRSRGLDEEAAKRLLTEAFAREVLESFGSGHQSSEFESCVLNWLMGEK